MYAIIAEDGRQYKVESGLVFNVDYRDGVQPGQKITFENVLLIGGEGVATKVGLPKVAGASVTAEVIGTKQGDKIYIQKFRRRKNERRRTGHRQIYTQVKINAINAG